MTVEGGSDHGEHLRGMREDVAVFEAEHGDARHLEQGVASALTGWRREVAAAVGFDDEAGLFAKEVHDERTERLLPPEPVCVQFRRPPSPTRERGGG